MGRVVIADLGCSFMGRSALQQVLCFLQPDRSHRTYSFQLGAMFCIGNDIEHRSPFGSHIHESVP